jgi:hypothetical protein
MCRRSVSVLSSVFDDLPPLIRRKQCQDTTLLSDCRLVSPLKQSLPLSQRLHLNVRCWGLSHLSPPLPHSPSPWFPNLYPTIFSPHHSPLLLTLHTEPYQGQLVTLYWHQQTSWGYDSQNMVTVQSRFRTSDLSITWVAQRANHCANRALKCQAEEEIKEDGRYAETCSVQWWRQH